MTAPASILLVEADQRFGEAIAQQLAADGYRVELARNARHARILASETRPRLAVLGRLEAPRGALSLLEEIRSDIPGRVWDRRLPALVIGGGAVELDALRAFEAGADDFVAMPVGYLELRARMCAVLRRSARDPDAQPVIEIGPLRIDPLRRAATLAGRSLALRRMEYELLLHLAGEPERVFSRTELLRAIWGYRSAGSTRTVDTHASRLRSKLGGGEGRWVIGVWGVGYRLR
jgi:two-component system phosphate regulon response regulator PhoB